MGRPSYLIHYASPYYDPVAAHEYYMKHRHLVGRKASLNEKGTAAKAVVKQRLDAERDSRLSAEDSSRESQLNALKSQRDEKAKQVKEQSQKSLEQAQTERYNNIVNHTMKARKEIKALRDAIQKGGLTGEQIKSNLNTIYKLREDNEKKRMQVEEAYKNRSTSIVDDYNKSMTETNNSYSSQTNSVKSSSQKNKENIRNEYKDKYDQELNAIYSNPEFIKTAKAKAGKSGSKKSSGSRAESLAAAWQRYNNKHK